MSKFNPVPREELVKSTEKDPNLLAQRCRRFNPFYQLWGDSQRGVLYLRLRSDGCTKKNALAFCSKPICREDSTRHHNGPSESRSLKVRNHSLVTLNGWQFTDLKYDLGKKYYTSSEDIVKVDEFDDLLQKHFMANEEKIKGDFKKKIKNLSEFYAELNKKYNFVQVPKAELIEKLRKMKRIEAQNKEQKKEINKHYIPCGDMKLKTIAKDILLNKHEETNLIANFRAFPKYNIKRIDSQDIDTQTLSNLGSPPKMQTPLLPPNHKRQSLNDIFTSPMPSPLLKKSTTMIIDDPNSINSIEENAKTKKKFEKPSKKVDLNKIKETASLFRSLEAQNNFINAITNEDAFVQVQTETRKRTATKNPPNPIITNTSAFPSKSLIAEEFNRANYMYGNEEEKKQSLTPKTLKSAKIKSILKHRRTLKSIQMGFAPDTFEKKIIFLQNKQKIVDENNRAKSKEISFFLPEDEQIENNAKNSPKKSILNFHKVKQRDSKTNNANNIMSIKSKTSEGTERPKIKIEHINFDVSLNEKANEDDENFVYTEDDEIEREIKFQNDLRRFTENQILEMNQRRSSLDVDQTNLRDFLNEIENMRKIDDKKQKFPVKGNVKNKNLKILMSSTYKNFAKTTGKFTSKSTNSNSTNFHF